MNWWSNHETQSFEGGVQAGELASNSLCINSLWRPERQRREIQRPLGSGRTLLAWAMSHRRNKQVASSFRRKVDIVKCQLRIYPSQ